MAFTLLVITTIALIIYVVYPRDYTSHMPTFTIDMLVQWLEERVTDRSNAFDLRYREDERTGNDAPIRKGYHFDNSVPAKRSAWDVSADSDANIPAQTTPSDPLTLPERNSQAVVTSGVV